MWAHVFGGPETAAYEKEREKTASLPAATYTTSENGGMGHRHAQAEKDPAPAILEQLVHRLARSSCYGHSLWPKPQEDGVRGWNDSSSA
jgi:hypothetical protein